MTTPIKVEYKLNSLNKTMKTILTDLFAVKAKKAAEKSAEEKAAAEKAARREASLTKRAGEFIRSLENFIENDEDQLTSWERTIGTDYVTYRSVSRIADCIRDSEFLFDNDVFEEFVKKNLSEEESEALRFARITDYYVELTFNL
jgi:hypothetical protein